MAKKTRKKYSVNVEDDTIVSVEVDGVKYATAGDIPDEHDRAMIESLTFGVPDADFGGLAGASSLPKLIMGIFLAVAVLLLTIAAISTVVTGRALAREVSAPGRVVELLGVSSTNGGTLYAPLVEFVGADNERLTVQAGGGSRPPAYKVGEPVTVRFDPANPHTARIASPGNNLDQYILALITGVLGLAFVGATVFAWWIGKQ